MQSVAARPFKSLLRNRIPGELSIRQRAINTGQVLINNPAGPKIKVANFGIPHLTVGQTDVGPARAQFTSGIIPIKVVMKGGFGEQRCISILFSFFAPSRIDPPAVSNDENNR